PMNWARLTPAVIAGSFQSTWPTALARQHERRGEERRTPREQEPIRVLDRLVHVTRAPLREDRVLLQPLRLVREHVLLILEERLIAREAVRRDDLALVLELAASAEEADEATDAVDHLDAEHLRRKVQAAEVALERRAGRERVRHGEVRK